MKVNPSEKRRLQSKKFLELGLIVSLVLHIFLLQGYKKLNIRTAQRQLELSSLEVIYIPSTKQESPKPPPNRPYVPIPTEIEYIPGYDPPWNDPPDPESIPLPNPPPPPKADWIPPFTPHETPPTPIGGYEAISKNLVYPRAARLSSIEGQVLIAALIDEEGRVDSTRVIKSLGPMGCDEAAIEAIRTVKWNPALQRNKAVKVWVSIPVFFRLAQR
jgi:protein TonB